LLSFAVLLITNNQIALQSMSVMAVTTCFLIISASALCYWLKNQVFIEVGISAWAIFSGLVVLLLSIQNVCKSGISFTFIGIFAFGIILAIGNHYYKCWQLKPIA
jgi:hypothetical protein